jgi:hypothetical protein
MRFNSLTSADKMGPKLFSFLNELQTKQLANVSFAYGKTGM